jgi:uncharacterized protein
MVKGTKLSDTRMRLARKGVRFSPEGINLGSLSPGCALCRKGRWLCVYVTGKCTRDCSFCPQEKSSHSHRGYRAYLTEWMRFRTADDVVEYMDYWGLQGLALSGGEPLCAFPKTVRLIERARRVFGKKVYIWLYTNGDLLTKEKARRLSKAGLDEIRFDLAANGYDTRPIEIASGLIPKITVEIPTIPKDEKVLCGIVRKLSALGVRNINLHELMISKENARRLGERLGKVVVAPAKGSLEASLRILQHIMRHNLRLNVNVCTLDYKKIIQTQRILIEMEKRLSRHRS